MDGTELSPARAWLVYLDGLPVAPVYPLTVTEAVELFEFYARRPSASVDIHQVVISREE